MKINHIFAAIELDSLDPRRFPRALVKAWRSIRFAQPPEGYAGSDKIGAALIQTPNFAWKSSGWFDRNGITFPAELLPTTREDLLVHLEWMLDCRRDPDTLGYLHHAINKQIPAPAEARGSLVWRTPLVKLVDDLMNLRRDEPLLANALLTGRLWRAGVLAMGKQKQLAEKKHLNTIIWMFIIWALFDLQVIGYRLFHSEWNPADAGPDSGERMTLGSLQKIAATMEEMAGATAAAFKNGGTLETIGPKLRAYIDSNDLLALAQKNASALGIDEEALASGAFDVHSLALCLRYLQRQLGTIKKLFMKRAYRRRLTLVGYANHAAGHSKARFTSKARKQLSKQTATTARFSVPALTGLLYAVEGVVGGLGSLPLRGKIRTSADGRVEGSRPLLGKQQRQQVVAALFTIYRDLFVRSVFNATDGVDEKEYPNLAREAEQAIAQGLGDPGLEPLHLEWAKRPIKPLFGGVRARRLIAWSQHDPGTYSLDPQDPCRWEPKRIDDEKKNDTRALRKLLTNPKARRHFRTKAERLDKGFGQAFSLRLAQEVGEPPEA